MFLSRLADIGHSQARATKDKDDFSGSSVVWRLSAATSQWAWMTRCRSDPGSITKQENEKGVADNDVAIHGWQPFIIILSLTI